MDHAVDTARAARERLAALLAQTADGDRSALRSLYGLTSAKLFGVCLRICEDKTGAQDVLQDVYIKVWRQAGRFDPARASPITWMATIARNTAIDWRRANKPGSDAGIEAAALVADDRPLADAGIEAAQERSRISDCLNQLDRKVATSIRDAFFGGSTYSELAERQAVPLGTMKTWIRRGLIQLKACLSDG